MGGLGLCLGGFGSVFNTFSSLYLAKDNDLLLSLPIPVRALMASRLLGVYLMGLMYSATVTLPAVIVYWVVASHSFAAILGGVLMVLAVSVLVLVLSCILGWAVAKISLKLRHKSFVTVLASLVFIGAYYFLYFRASRMIQTLTLNAMEYGETIQGKAYPVYLFGRAWEGDPLALLVTLAVTAALLALTCYVLSRSFLRVATSSGAVGKVKYHEKAVKPRSLPRAMLGKELARFTASPNYMLNCGLGLLFLPIVGVVFLVKAAWFRDLIALLGWEGAFLTLMRRPPPRLRPPLHWTTAIAPLQQSLSVTVALFGGWALAALLMLAGWRLPLPALPLAWAYTALLAAAAILLLHWLKTTGAKTFAAL